jgi:hypothetical protein
MGKLEGERPPGGHLAPGRIVREERSSFALDVAGEDRQRRPVGRTAEVVDDDHLGCVVVLAEPFVRGRMKPAPAEGAESPLVAAGGDRDRNVGGAGRADEGCSCGRRVALGGVDEPARHDQGTDRRPAEKVDDAGEVIEVRVRHDDRVESGHIGFAERRSEDRPREAPCRGRSCIEEDGSTSRPDEIGRSIADGEHRQRSSIAETRRHRRRDRECRHEPPHEPQRDAGCDQARWSGRPRPPPPDRDRDYAPDQIHPE